jgi:hypothetical protein
MGANNVGVKCFLACAKRKLQLIIYVQRTSAVNHLLNCSIRAILKVGWCIPDPEMSCKQPKHANRNQENGISKFKTDHIRNL